MSVALTARQHKIRRIQFWVRARGGSSEAWPGKIRDRFIVDRHGSGFPSWSIFADLRILSSATKPKLAPALIAADAASMLRSVFLAPGFSQWRLFAVVTCLPLQARRKFVFIGRENS